MWAISAMSTGHGAEDSEALMKEVSEEENMGQGPWLSPPGVNLSLGQVASFYDYLAGSGYNHKTAQLCPSKLPNMRWHFTCEDVWP